MKVHVPNDNSGRPSIVHIVTSRLSVRTILRAKIRGLARRGYRQWVISADDGGPADLPDGVSLLNVPIPRAISPAGDL